MIGLSYINSHEFAELVDRLLSSYRLVAPIEHMGYFAFGIPHDGDEVRLDYSITRLPPKFVFLPQSEELFRYDIRDGHIFSDSAEPNRTVLFGIRPCDASSISILDSVMLGKYADPYYDSRRKNTTVVALSCQKPLETCFCNVFRTGPIEGRTIDLTLTKIDDGYVAKSVSPKGDSLIANNQDLFGEADRSQEEKYISLKRSIEASFSSDFKLDQAWQTRSEAFGDPIWADLARKCISCGICSFVCPTCYCFDVCDFASRGSGSRAKGWDSCVFSTFSRMTSGLDPRPTGTERLRHRFYHKFEYVPESFGPTACVGCGRCLALCPVNISPKEVLGI